MLSVGFGENGVVTYASGSLATPERGGDYPTTARCRSRALEDTTESVHRPRLHQRQKRYGRRDSVAATRGATDVEATAVLRSSRPSLPTSCSLRAEAAALIAPSSVRARHGHIEQRQGRPHDAVGRRQHHLAAAAYTFGTADGGMYSVLAVDDAYIQEVDPPIAVSEPAVTTPARNGHSPSPYHGDRPRRTEPCLPNRAAETVPHRLPIRVRAGARSGACGSSRSLTRSVCELAPRIGAGGVKR